ncbi:hypothetical protein BDF14DRAFT_1824181 [Spinellus fusiger]|nr:hypothetical protein BDF14DRAFT_1824181 [Spinellus fusiger]
MTKTHSPSKHTTGHTAEKVADTFTTSPFRHIQPKGSWEIPRKLFHYSIGFGVYALYNAGYDTTDIYPPLTAGLSVVVSAEVLRFSWDWFNRFYCRLLGPLMRRTEVTKVNGVVYYLAGCVAVLYVFPKDIASLSIMYLSWADPTASICGQLWGKYTPKYGKKSLAGTLGATVTGALVTFGFLGPFASLYGTPSYDIHQSGFRLPLLSVYGGIVAGLSEAMGDVLGVDDNFTLPVLSGLFLWVPLVGLGLGSSSWL